MTEVQADTSSNKDNSNSNRSTVSSSSAYNNKLENVLILQGLVVECRDEKVAHETHYYADPFEPPEWRSQWVERTD
jgi:hypothetical protein